MNPRQEVFVDHLCLASVAGLIWHCGLSLSRDLEIRYVRSASGSALRLLRRFERGGWFRGSVEKSSYFFGHFRTSDGSPRWLKYYGGDLVEICQTIRNRDLSRSAFISGLARKFNLQRVLTYYQKKAAAEITEVGVTILAAHCLYFDRMRRVEGGSTSCLLFIESTHWFPHLRRYAMGYDVQLASYSRLDNDLLRPLAGFLADILRALWTFTGHCLRGRAARRRIRGGDIAIPYAGRELSFDPRDRSDFFWWPKSGILSEELLVYFGRPDAPLTADLARILESHGVGSVALGKHSRFSGEAGWEPSIGFVVKAAVLFSSIARSLAWCLIRGQWDALYYFVALIPLIRTYVLYYEFYRTFKVKLDINFGEFASVETIGAHLALRDLNGVSLSYQVSNLSYTHIGIIPCADVVLTFSPAVAPSWHRLKAPVAEFVSVGYVYDSAFHLVQERALEARESMLAKGVEFIICYFDENSTDSESGIVSNEDAAEEYEILLRYILSDASLGLVLKPKKPRTLPERISRVMPLLRQARQSGQLVLLDDGDRVTATFPAEAAQIADVTIGNLVGTTAALEASLAGIPTVLVDTLGIHDHPFYAWGRNKVVFRGWDALLKAIRRYRKDKESVAGFGDWSPAITEIDAFRDGQASTRVGAYVRQLLTCLRSGMTPDAAIAYSTDHHRANWSSPLHQTFQGVQ